MSCCPHLRTPSPCSSTHPGTPARTLCISGGTLKKRTALSLNLPPVSRAQVEFEVTPPILRGDNAISVLQMRDGAACFAVLDVLPVRGATGACAVGGRCRSFARAREPKDGGLAQSMPWTGHMHADRMCNYVFRKRER